MKKIFIETSVFIRFLTKDDPQKYEDCVMLFKLIEEGKIRPYISNIVILEIIFILNRHYNFAKARVLEVIDKLLLLRNLTLIEKTNTTPSLSLFKKYNIKYGDCLIANQLKKGITLVSYDKDFDNVKNLKVLSPKLVVKQAIEISS